MYQIGIDLGGMTIKGGIVSDNGDIIAEKSVPTLAERENDEIIKSIANLVLDLIDENNLTKDDIKSVGIGTPGIVNAKEGIVIKAYNLGFDNVNLGKSLTDMLGIDVFVENDANVAGFGEYVMGSAKGYKNVVMLTIGTGLGSCIIINENIISGSFNGGGELGHMVIHAGGKSCSCGRNGCFEAYGSASALISLMREVVKENTDSLLYKMVDGDLEKLNPIILFEAKNKGDECAIKILDEYNSYFAEGLANIINTLEPEVIVIGGGMSKQDENLLADIRKLTYEKCFGKRSDTKIVSAKLFNRAGIIGASFLGK